MVDFEVPRRAARRAAVGEPLYQSEDGHFQFKYLPAFAVLAIPVGALPLPVAKAGWFFGSVVLLVVFLGLSVRVLPEQKKRTGILVGFAVLALGKFYVREVGLGQVNLLFGVAATGALLALRARREMLAAALVVLTVAIKPYGIVLFPVLLVRRQWKPLAAAGIGMGLLLLLPVPFYGWTRTIALHWSWWQTVTRTTPGDLLVSENVSLASMYAKWIGSGAVSVALTVATALGLAAGAVMVFRRRRAVVFPEGLEGSLLLLLVPLLSPQGWDYVLLLGTPAVMLLTNYSGALPPLWRRALVAAGLTMGFSIFDLMGRAAYTAFMSTAIISVCALALAAALGILRQRAVA